MHTKMQRGDALFVIFEDAMVEMVFISETATQLLLAKPEDLSSVEKGFRARPDKEGSMLYTPKFYPVNKHAGILSIVDGRNEWDLTNAKKRDLQL